MSSSPTLSGPTIQKVDKYLQAASDVAFKLKLHDVAIVSCQFSVNVLQNNIADFLLCQDRNPSIIIVPIVCHNRVSLAVFNSADKKLGYFDSQKDKKIPDNFWLTKYSIEKYLSCKFDVLDQELINASINDCPPECAVYHICRIAEEICFTGKNRRIAPWDIRREVERIDKQFFMINQPGWKGDWLPTIRDVQMENVIRNVISSTSINPTPNHILPSRIYPGQNASTSFASAAAQSSNSQAPSAIPFNVRGHNPNVFVQPQFIRTPNIAPNQLNYVPPRYFVIDNASTSAATNPASNNGNLQSPHFTAPISQFVNAQIVNSGNASTSAYIPLSATNVEANRSHPSATISPQVNYATSQLRSLLHNTQRSNADIASNSSNASLSATNAGRNVTGPHPLATVSPQLNNAIYSLTNAQRVNAGIASTSVFIPPAAPNLLHNTVTSNSNNSSASHAPQHIITNPASNIMHRSNAMFSNATQHFNNQITNNGTTVYVSTPCNRSNVTMSNPLTLAASQPINNQTTHVQGSNPTNSAPSLNNQTSSNIGIAFSSAPVKPSSIESANIPSRKNVDENGGTQVPSNMMQIYEMKFPVLSRMLKFYLNFTKYRFDSCNRKLGESILNNNFVHNDYIRMNHREFEKVETMFADFPCMDKLSIEEKTALLKRFREPFFMLDRVYDTLENGKQLGEKCILLQNGNAYVLADLMEANNHVQNLGFAKVFKVIFEAWSSLLPLVKKIGPDIMELMYIFCCMLWNHSGLSVPLAEAAKEAIERERLQIHRELREFYGFDDEQWNRIFVLKHAASKVESFVNDFKRACSTPA